MSVSYHTAHTKNAAEREGWRQVRAELLRLAPEDPDELPAFQQTLLELLQQHYPTDLVGDIFSSQFSGQETIVSQEAPARLDPDNEATEEARLIYTNPVLQFDPEIDRFAVWSFLRASTRRAEHELEDLFAAFSQWRHRKKALSCHALIETDE